MRRSKSHWNKNRANKRVVQSNHRSPAINCWTGSWGAVLMEEPIVGPSAASFYAQFRLTSPILLHYNPDYLLDLLWTNNISQCLNILVQSVHFRARFCQYILRSLYRLWTIYATRTHFLHNFCASEFFVRVLLALFPNFKLNLMLISYSEFWLLLSARDEERFLLFLPHIGRNWRYTVENCGLRKLKQARTRFRQYEV
jgi:hypothetical protein